MSRTIGFKDFLLENAKQPLCNLNMWVIIGHGHQLQNIRPTKISLGYISTYLHGVQYNHPQKTKTKMPCSIYLFLVEYFSKRYPFHGLHKRKLFCQEIPFMACMRGNYFSTLWAHVSTIQPFSFTSPQELIFQFDIHASYKWWTEVQQKKYNLINC